MRKADEGTEAILHKIFDVYLFIRAWISIVDLKLKAEEERLSSGCSLRAERIYRDLAFYTANSQIHKRSNAAQVAPRTRGGCFGCVGTKLQLDSRERNLEGCNSALQSYSRSEKPWQRLGGEIYLNKRDCSFSIPLEKQTRLFF